MSASLFDAMAAQGLTPPANIPPGKYTRFPSNGKAHDKAGWCYVFPDLKGAVFGDHRTGLHETWQAERDTSMTAEERQAWAVQVAKAKAEAQDQRESEYIDAARKAKKELVDACTAADPAHGYLAAKGIKPWGAKQDAKGNLVIPVSSVDGETQSLQRISGSGRKSFFTGGQMKGGMYWLRDPGDVIYLGEGFATMASVAEAVPDGGVACCFSAGGLAVAAKAIRQKHLGAQIVVCGDHDTSGVGQKAATEAAQGVGARVALPGAVGDWNDVYRRDGAQAVRDGIATATATAVARTELQLDNGVWPALIGDVIERLADESAVFDFGGVLVAIDANGAPFPIGSPWLSTDIERRFTVQKFNERAGGYVPARIPLEFAQRVLAAKESWRFPTLNGLTGHRVLRPDGSILSKHGYDESTGLYLHHLGGAWVQIPSDIREAVQTLWFPISQMPYVSPADSGAAFALLLTAIQRPALPLAPLFIIAAPAIASGKTKIGTVAKLLAGADDSVEGLGTTPEEQQKRIFAMLLRGSPAVLLDNLSGSLGGDDLASVLTSRTYSSRILGQSATASVPTRMLWMATGINLIPAADLTRRTLTIRVDPKVERPETRQFEFDPDEWTRDHLEEMQAAALAILRHARPHPSGRLGSFTEWSDSVRAAVLTLIDDGLTPCPMADPLDVVARERDTDPEAEELAAVLHGWHALIGERFVTIKDLIERANSCGDSELLVALAAIAGTSRGDVNARRLGNYLRRHESRIVEGLQVRKGRETRLGVAWKVTDQGCAGFAGLEGSFHTYVEFSQETNIAKHIEQGETNPRNPPNPHRNVCPACSGEGCEWCHGEGVMV